MRLIVLILLSVLLLHSCISSQKDMLVDLKKMNDCVKKWEERITQDTVKARVLLFENKTSYTTAQFSAFIIGVTPYQDTIAFIDNSFNGKLKANDNITFVGSIQKMDRNLRILPASGRNKKNNLHYCKVKFYSFGKFIDVN